MSIVGIGSEIVECLRIRRMIELHGELFLFRVFTPFEIQLCQQRKYATEHFAARWAAKTAVLKALGFLGRQELWIEMETRQLGVGTTEISFRGPMKELLEQKGVSEVLLTMAYCRAYATATAIAIRR